MDNQDTVLLERVADVVTLKLNIPQRLNPLSHSLQIRLRERLAALRADKSVRALVLTGEGKAFCVGADLSSMSPREGQSLGQATRVTMETLTNPLVQDVRSMPFPVVSAVNGACAGAGVGLALAADVVIAARSAYFYLPFMPRLGIIPDLGATWHLERLVGRARAVAMSLLNERLSAEQAQQWGLIWQVADDAELPAAAQALANRLARLPAHAATEMRAVYELAGQQGLDAQLQTEAEFQGRLIGSPDFDEGVAAFLAKRDPVFKQR